MNDDQSLAEPTTQSPAGTPFGDPDGAPVVRHQLTVEEVLASAKRVQKIARVCLRADLQAEREEILAELGTLVTADGQLIEEPEASAADVGSAGRALELNDRLTSLGRQMAGAMWSVRFEAMSSDDWPVFVKAHFPKQSGEERDLTDFNTKLIAETAIEPKLTVAQVQALRKKLGPSQITHLANTAYEACTQGGLDVPKSPASLRALTQRSSAGS